MHSARSLSKTERKQEMIKKYSEEKRQGVIEARKDDCSNDWSRANNGKSMAERCRMEKLKVYKSRVQFSDNPETIVQQQKN